MGSPQKKAPTSNAPAEHGVIRSACPICRTAMVTRDLAADKHFPFCSRRCKLIDLGRWFDGAYQIGGPLEEKEDE